MPRPRTPTNVLDLKGAFKHNPDRGRARADEPVPVAEIGGAPAHFSDEERAAYDELVRKSHPGVMCDSDSVVVELGAVLLAKLRADTRSFTAPEFGRLQMILGVLGMTPADRSKVSAIKPKKSESPLDEFASQA